MGSCTSGRIGWCLVAGFRLDVGRATDLVKALTEKEVRLTLAAMLTILELAVPDFQPLFLGRNEGLE